MSGGEAANAVARLLRRPQVLMVSDVCHPRVNGVSTSIDTFAAALARLGVRVTLVAPDYAESHPDADACAEVIRIPRGALPSIRKTG